MSTTHHYGSIQQQNKRSIGNRKGYLKQLDNYCGISIIQDTHNLLHLVKAPRAPDVPHKLYSTALLNIFYKIHQRLFPRFPRSDSYRTGIVWVSQLKPEANSSNVNQIAILDVAPLP